MLLHYTSAAVVGTHLSLIITSLPTTMESAFYDHLGAPKSSVKKIDKNALPIQHLSPETIL